MLTDALGNEIKVGDTILYALGCKRSSGCLALYEVTQAEEYKATETSWNRYRGEWVTQEVAKIRFGGIEKPLPGEAPWGYEVKGHPLRHPKAALVVTGLDLLALTRAGDRNHE